jgi:hypothetical protein
MAGVTAVDRFLKKISKRRDAVMIGSLPALRQSKNDRNGLKFHALNPCPSLLFAACLNMRA